MVLQFGVIDCIDVLQGDVVVQLCEFIFDGVDYVFDVIGCMIIIEQFIWMLGLGGVVVIVGFLLMGVCVLFELFVFVEVDQCIFGLNYGLVWFLIDVLVFVDCYMDDQLKIDLFILGCCLLFEVVVVFDDFEVGFVFCIFFIF